MKMLFYSSDNSEVDRVSQEFINAGIPCEIRNGPAVNGHSAQPPQAELWIHNDADCHRAFMLCVHLGVGFAKRAPKKPLFDGTEFEPPREDEDEAESEPKPEELELERVLVAKRVKG